MSAWSWRGGSCHRLWPEGKGLPESSFSIGHRIGPTILAKELGCDASSPFVLERDGRRCARQRDFCWHGIHWSPRALFRKRSLKERDGGHGHCLPAHQHQASAGGREKGLRDDQWPGDACASGGGSTRNLDREEARDRTDQRRSVESIGGRNEPIRRKGMIEIKPIQQCDTVIKIPGSKSYTHRALILSALADGESTLIDPLRSEDTEITARGLERLGIPVLWEGNSIRVSGRGGRLEGRGERIDVGNSGTSMRFLTALAALKKGQTVLDGDDRMRVRPMGGLLESLEGLGAEARSQRGNDCPPVIIESQGLRGGRTKVRSHESSQYLSGLLMIAPYAREDVCLSVEGTLVSRPYIDITLSVMSAFGVGVCCEGNHSFFIRAGQRYQGQGLSDRRGCVQCLLFSLCGSHHQGKGEGRELPILLHPGRCRIS